MSPFTWCPVVNHLFYKITPRLAVQSFSQQSEIMVRIINITDYWSSTADHYDKYSLIINPQTTKSPPSLLTTVSSDIHTSGGNVIFTCVNSVYNVHCNLHAFMQNFYTFVVIVGAASTSFCQLWQKAACDLLLPPPLVGPRQSDPTPRCKQGTWNKLI